MPNSSTTVRISRKTRKLLDEVAKEVGSFGETYDDIIFKLLEKEKNNKSKGENK